MHPLQTKEVIMQAWSARSAILLAFLAVLVGTSLTIPAAASVNTTFDTGLEGWLITGDNAFVWSATGGNPDGCLNVNDLATGAHNYAVAPPKFLGDWSTATAADTLSHEVFLINTSGGPHCSPGYVFRIAGPGGAAHALDRDANYPPQYVWTTLKVSLDPADWTIESGTWSAILSNVTSLQISAEFVYGGEEVRLDNIYLSVSPVRVFGPCVYCDFASAGTGDWTLQGTDGASNPGSGGNGGGYVLINDKSGTNSYAYAPSMFLGDWSSLDDAGYVRIDLRILSRDGTNEGSSEFIRLSGGGGMAHVSLDASDLSAGSLNWVTYAFPIAESGWVLDSGTWHGLLASVEEVRIDLEFFTGTEQVGFDNFGRMADSCPAIDDTVTVYDPGVFACGYYSLVGVAGIARNPLDGELYGLGRADPSSGGGLYGVTGPGAGVRLASYDRPAGLLFDTDGDAFVSEDYGGNVYRLEWGGVSSVWVSGFHTGDDDPYGMCFAPPGFNGPNVSGGDILISDRGNNGPDEVWAFSPDISENERLVMPDPGDVDHFDLTAGPYDTVYVCDGLNGNSLFKLDAFGNLTSFPLSMSIATPGSIVYDDVDSCLYVAGIGNDRVYRVNSLTGATALIASGFGALPLCCLEIDPPSRRLWVATTGYGRVYQFCLEDPAGVGPHFPERSADRFVTATPNPSRIATEIHFALGEPSRARVSVYSVCGQLVTELLDSDMPAGDHSVAWDGRDEKGEPVTPGVYFVRLDTPQYTRTAKVLVVK
jgi:hypothetical protein